MIWSTVSSCPPLFPLSSLPSKQVMFFVRLSVTEIYVYAQKKAGDQFIKVDSVTALGKVTVVRKAWIMILAGAIFPPSPQMFSMQQHTVTCLKTAHTVFHHSE